jgi:hypothetical protein
MDNTELVLRVCNGHRPNIDKIPIPQLLKDLIKRCLDSEINNRPKAEELEGIICNWKEEIESKKNTPFYQQYKEVEAEYNTFYKNTPYQIHSNAITTSKMIDTKQITELLSKDYSLELKFQNAMFNSKITNELDIKSCKFYRRINKQS